MSHPERRSAPGGAGWTGPAERGASFISEPGTRSFGRVVRSLIPAVVVCAGLALPAPAPAQSATTPVDAVPVHSWDPGGLLEAHPARELRSHSPPPAPTMSLSGWGEVSSFVAMAGDTIDPPPADPAVEALGEVPDVSPGGAFVRSLVLPGWGHAATGSHFRGGFYMAAQSGAIWMLSKSMAAHQEARRFRNEEIRAVTDQLRASGIVQPDTLRILAEADPRVEEWDELVDARSEQVEDWAAAGIFILLLSATDAFVSGHLMDRPEPLTIQVGPVVRGRWEISVGVPWGSRPWRR